MAQGNSDARLTTSIIVCAYTEKRWDLLVQVVESLQQQTHPPDQILLSIDHNPALYERAKAQFPDVDVIENTDVRGLSGARNSGIHAATGEIIVFIDDDAIAEPDWLAHLVAGYRDETVVGVGGKINPMWETARPHWFPEEYDWVVGCTYKGLPESTSPIRNMIGCNMSMRRNVFDKAGLFQTDIGRIDAVPLGCEETELCIRMRQRAPQSVFIYEPAAQVNHFVPANRVTWQYFRSRCFSEGISKALIGALVGAKDGLSSETSHVMVTLPKAMLRNLKDVILKADLWGAARAAIMPAGVLFAGLGYLKGQMTLYRRRRMQRLALQES